MTTWQEEFPDSRVRQRADLAYQSIYTIDEPIALGIAAVAAASEVWPPVAKVIEIGMCLVHEDR